MATDKEADLLRDIERFECGKVPSALEMKRAARLEEWEANVRRRGKVFVLVIYGALQELEEPMWVTTGAVVWLDRRLRFARTHTRLYTLGQPAGTPIPIDGIEV